MIDTTAPAPVSAAPASVVAPVAPAAPVAAVATPAPAATAPAASVSVARPLPPIDFGAINTQEDADKLISQLTPDEVSQILSGKSPEEVISARSATPAVAPTAAPNGQDAPEQKSDETPAEGHSPTEDPSDTELTAEVLAEAHPALKALHEENIQLLEEMERLEKVAHQPAKSKYANDPFIRMREEMLEKGDLEIPVVIDFERDLGANLGEEVKALLADEKLSDEDVVAALVGKMRSFQKEANSRLVGNLNAARDAWKAEGEKIATFRTELQEFCKTIPEAKMSADPILVRAKDGSYALNEAHPASAFATWVKDAAGQGLITDEQVRQLGWGWAYTTWKSATQGHNQHMANVRQSAVADRLAKQRALRDSVTKGLAAQTLGLPSNASSTQGNMFHGFALDWIKASPENALQAQAKWRAEGNAKAVNELIELLTR